MPHRLRSGIHLALSVFIVAGCASPTQLNFDTAEPPMRQTASSLEDSQTVEDSIVSDSSPTIESMNATGGFDAASIERHFTNLVTDWSRCFHRPGDCDVTLSTAPDSPERSRLSDALAYYATEQLRTKPNQGRLEWRIESISATSDNRVRITTCEYDTRIFFDASMADTELGDIILDATVWTRRVEWVVARDGDAWRLWSRRIERRSPAERFCQV